MANLALNDEDLHAVFCLAFGLPITTTQTVIAEKLGMRQTLYSRIVRGERMSASQLAKHLRTAGLNDLADAIERAAEHYTNVMTQAQLVGRKQLAENINVHVARELGRLANLPGPAHVRHEN